MDEEPFGDNDEWYKEIIRGRSAGTLLDTVIKLTSEYWRERAIGATEEAEHDYISRRLKEMREGRE